MPSRNIRRGSAILGAAGRAVAPIYVDSDDNKLKFIPAGSGTTEVVLLDGSNPLLPTTTDSAAIGSATLMWSDLFLASGGVVNFNNGNVTLTHAAGKLTVAVPAPTSSIDCFTVGFTSGSATPGSCRAIVGSATTFTSQTSGNTVGVRGVATVGGTMSSAAYVYGVQGKLVLGANTVTGKTTAAVYAQYDVTGGVVTSGDSAGVVSLITGATALGGNGSGQFPGLDGVYVESVGGGNIHSVLRFLGGAEYCFDLTDGGVADFILAAGTGSGSAGQSGGFAATKVLKCYIDGAAMYIPLCSTNA